MKTSSFWIKKVVIWWLFDGNLRARGPYSLLQTSIGSGESGEGGKCKDKMSYKKCKKLMEAGKCEEKKVAKVCKKTCDMCEEEPKKSNHFRFGLTCTLRFLF